MPKNKPLPIRFTDAELEFIRAYAERWGVSLSEAVRMILHEWIGMVMLTSRMSMEDRAKILSLLENH